MDDCWRSDDRNVSGLTARGRKQALHGDPAKDIDRGVAVAFGVPLMWSCASDKIAEAEKLLAK
jgi:hypothetical protein